MLKITFKNLTLPLILVLTFISACSTPQHQALRKIEVGMAKADVLDAVGNPNRKSRMLGQDRWTYEGDGESGAEATYIFFQDGKVTYVGGAEDHVDTATKKNQPANSSSKFKPVGE